MRFTAAAFAIVCLALPLAPAFAEEVWVCDNSRNNAEHLQCADREYKKHDAELNRVYKALLKSSADSNEALEGYGVPPLDALKQSQRAWVAFRDSNCHWKSSSFYGGTGQSVIMSSCLAIATRDRVRELQSSMQE